MADGTGAGPLVLAATETQLAYRAALRAFLSARQPEPVVREQMMAAGADRSVWRELCVQLGVAGLGVAEERGGSGGDLADLAVAFEELGRVLADVPALASVALARTALLATGDDEASDRWLPAIVDGSVVATLTWPEGGDRLAASATPAGHVLDGVAAMVLDGADADLVLVVAELSGAGPSVFAVDTGVGLRRAPLLPTLDLTRRFARIEFSSTPAEPVGRPGDGARVLATTLDVARVLLAAEQLGGAGRCLELSVEYARTRLQFGRAIGSFQSIKHRCADMLARTEMARTAVSYAAWTAGVDREALVSAAALAKAVTSEAYLSIAGETIQVHGGLGFTWEAAPHLYLKRARSMSGYLGGPVALRRVLAEQLAL